jgi:hypothetical protein
VLIINKGAAGVGRGNPSEVLPVERGWFSAPSMLDKVEIPQCNREMSVGYYSWTVHQRLSKSCWSRSRYSKVHLDL